MDWGSFSWTWALRGFSGSPAGEWPAVLCTMRTASRVGNLPGNAPSVGVSLGAGTRIRARSATLPSTAIGLRKYRIPSDLRSQAECRPVSTMVGDHMGILGAVVFAAASFCGLGERPGGGDQSTASPSPSNPPWPGASRVDAAPAQAN